MPIAPISGIFRNVVGTAIRKIGQASFKLGSRLNPYVDVPMASYRCRPSLKAFNHDFVYNEGATQQISQQAQQATMQDKLKDYAIPNIALASFIAPNAAIFGDVTLGESSAIAHGVILRGDIASINIGKHTHIQDNTVLCPSIRMIQQMEGKYSPVANGRIEIGNQVIIGPNSYLDTCTISNRAIVSAGAYVSKGCSIGEGAIVAAGAVLLDNTIVPSGQIWAGNPAKYLREASAEEKLEMDSNLGELDGLAKIYNEECEKSNREVIEDALMKEEYDNLPIYKQIIKIAKEQGLPTSYDDSGLGAERLPMDAYSKAYYSEDNTIPNFIKKEMLKRRNTHYEQDLSKYPEVMKVFAENYGQYDKLKKQYDNEKEVSNENFGTNAKKEESKKYIFKNVNSTQ